MPDPNEPSIRGQRSLALTIPSAAAVFGVVIPFEQWASARLFGDPVPRAPVWLRFAVVLAVAGACAGAVMYRATRLPHGWIRSLLYGFVFAVVITAEIDNFVSMSGAEFIVHWVLGSVFVGLVLGVLFHALGGANQRRPAR
ncbi:MAG TPA: hypothetical protein VF006_20935 [Longimicrobium sp.]